MNDPFDSAEQPAVVLVRPSEEGNVGAAARAMANMGLERLILVEPAVDLGRVARAFAVRAEHVLEGLERMDSLASAVAPYQRVVGTTGSLEQRVSQPLLTARELALRWRDPGRGWLPSALVFGPESSGLTTEELALCGAVVRIPCARRQPSLNLGQAVLLVAYELFQADPEEAGPRPSPAPRATSGELDGLFAQATAVLEEVGFARDDTFGSVLRDLRSCAARSDLSQREVSILRGICRRTLHALAGRVGKRDR